MKKTLIFFYIGITICIFFTGCNRYPTNLNEKFVEYNTCEQIIEYGKYEFSLDQYVYNQDMHTIAARIKISEKGSEYEPVLCWYYPNCFLLHDINIAFCVKNKDNEESTIQFFKTASSIRGDGYFYFGLSLKDDIYENKIFILDATEYSETEGIKPNSDNIVGSFTLDYSD